MKPVVSCNYLRLGPALLLAVLLSGCSTPTYYPPRPRAQLPPPVVEQGTQLPPGPGASLPGVRPPVTVPPVQPPQQQPVDRPRPAAVVALLDTAEQQANEGDLEAAAASLERAIRIDPRNPALWFHLGTVRLSQGDALGAEQLAVKSNSLSTGNTVQQARNWNLIARARRSRDDTAGAQEAERKARALR